MKKVIYLKLFLCCLAVTSLCISCKHEKLENFCKTCVPLEPSLKRLIQFDVKEKSFFMNADIWFKKENVDYQFASVSLTSQETFDNLVKKVFQDQQTIDMEKIESCTLFYKGLLTESLLINLEDIFAFSIYSYNKIDKIFTHDFYEINGNKVNHDNALSCQVSDIVVNDIHSLNQIHSFKYKSSASISVLSPRFRELDMKDLNSTHELTYKIQNLKKLFNASTQNKVAPIGEGDRCPFPCPSTPENRRCVTSTYGSYKCDGTCFLRTSAHQEDVNNYWTGVDSLSILVQEKSLYDFRDNLLSLNSWGNKYINYYYDLSDAFQNNVDLTTIITTLRLLPKVYNCINDVVDANNNPDKIVITPFLKDQFVNIVNIYKSKTKDPSIILKLNDIIQDLNNLVNKNALYIDSKLKAI